MKDFGKKNESTTAGTVVDSKIKLHILDSTDGKDRQEKLVTDDFLSTGSIVPKHDLKCLENADSENKTYIKDEHIKDLEILSATKLREKYKPTYSSWKNMKQRAKKQGYIIHQEFEEFKDFLRHVGPRKNNEYTLDRIDNTDLEYGPGKVEWRDKYAQNSNKSNNVYLVHDDGRKRTIAQWASITKQKPGTLYKRKKNGWTDMEIITGVRNSQILSDVEDPFPYDTKDFWERKYIEAYCSGYKRTRLQFLCEEVKRAIPKIQETNTDLSCEIEFYEMTNPDHEKLPDLKKNLDRLTKYHQRLFCIYQQASQLLNYEQEKEYFLDSIQPSKSQEKKCVEHFEKYHPKPKYTINKPG
jgi:hypothetical protein